MRVHMVDFREQPKEDNQRVLRFSFETKAYQNTALVTSLSCNLYHKQKDISSPHAEDYLSHDDIFIS